MIPDGLQCRDFVQPDGLAQSLVQATLPGNEQLVKGGAASAVAILVEIDIETGS